MHIPDGFLSTPVWATLDAVALPAIGWVAKRARGDADESRTPLLGVLGAFVFAAQMVNFPIAPGTSAHLLGGALLACTVGPAASILVLTAVLAIQAMVFQDGGLLALGANFFNIAVVGTLAGWAPGALFAGRWRKPSLFLGGLLSVVLSGGCALAELLLSGVRIPTALFSGALVMFVISGLIEGVITVAVVGAIGRINPGWVRSSESRTAHWGLAVGAALMAVFGFVFASASPDSLEAIAQQVGLAGRETQLMTSPLADYAWQGVPFELLARASAGLIGIALVYVAVVAFSRAIRGSNRSA